MKVETGLPLYMSCIRLKLRGEGVVTLCYNMTSKGIAPSKLSFVDPPPLKVYLCSFYKFEANSERFLMFVKRRSYQASSQLKPVMTLSLKTYKKHNFMIRMAPISNWYFSEVLHIGCGVASQILL